MADENSLEVYWNRINRRLQGNKPNRWIKLSVAVRLIAQKLNEMASEARELLHTKALPPDVPWVGVVRAWWEDENTAAVIEIKRELLIRAQIDLVADIILLDNEYRTSEYDSHFVSLKYDNFYVEQNHLEAWLEKQKAQVVQLAPSAPASGGRASKDETVDPYNTGMPGRPTIKHLINVEFQRRVKAEETLTSIGAEAEALREWALKRHPEAPTPTKRSIENQIRPEYLAIKEKVLNRTKL